MLHLVRLVFFLGVGSSHENLVNLGDVALATTIATSGQDVNGEFASDTHCVTDMAPCSRSRQTASPCVDGPLMVVARFSVDDLHSMAVASRW